MSSHGEDRGAGPGSEPEDGGPASTSGERGPGGPASTSGKGGPAPTSGKGGPGGPAPPSGKGGPGGPAPGPAAGEDHGAAAERTRLAWRRTLMSVSVVALLVVRPVFDPAAGAADWLVAAAAMLGWVGLVAITYRRQHGLTGRPPQRGRRTIAACALISVSFAILGGLVVML